MWSVIMENLTIKLNCMWRKKRQILIGGELHQLELFEGSNRQNEFLRGVKWTSRTFL
jgi:hypothetical protein